MAEIEKDTNTEEMGAEAYQAKTQSSDAQDSETQCTEAQNSEGQFNETQCSETGADDGAAQNKKETQEEEILQSLSGICTRLEALQECFNDKIAVDAHKNALFDNMHRELIKYQNGIMDKLLETMALDIIQLIDAIKGNIRVYEKKEPNGDNYIRLLKIVKGIAQDLEDILYRQSIEPYRVAGHEVDVKRQKIIQTMDTDDERKHNLVAVRVADGYEKEGKVIRPERIKIYKYSPENKEE